MPARTCDVRKSQEFIRMNIRVLLLLYVFAGSVLASTGRVVDIDTAWQQLNAASAILDKQQDRVRYLKEKVDGIKERVDASEGMARCLAMQEQRFWEEELTASQVQLQRFDAELAPFARDLDGVLRRSYRDAEVKPGDLIDVTIMPDMIRGQYRVNERGYVLLPRISLLYVGCLNVNDCEEQIRERMVERGFRDVWIHLRVVEESVPEVGPVTATFAPRIIATQKDIGKLAARLTGSLEWWERLSLMEEMCKQQDTLDQLHSALDADINADRLAYTIAKAGTLDNGYARLLSDHEARAGQLAKKVAAIRIRVQVLEHMLADESVGYKAELRQDLAFWTRRLEEARIEAECHQKLSDKHARWLHKAMADLPEIPAAE